MVIGETMVGEGATAMQSNDAAEVARYQERARAYEAARPAMIEWFETHRATLEEWSRLNAEWVEISTFAHSNQGVSPPARLPELYLRRAPRT